MTTDEHLAPETLARLVDEPPTPREARHLDTCPRCRGGLRGLEADRAALGSLPDPGPLPDEWERLEAAMEGHWRRTAHPDSAPRQAAPTPRGLPVWLRVAAVLALLLTGGIGGWWMGSAAGGPGGVATPTDGPPSPSLVVALEELLESAPTAPLDAATAEAFAVLSGELHRTALVRVREERTRLEPVPPDGWEAVTRFAALDHLLGASRDAVRAAPTDPYLNHLLLELQAERDHVLGQGIVPARDDSWF